jgi:hypothetical protein
MLTIANTNDGSGRGPRLRIGLNLLTVTALPAWSQGPKGEPLEMLVAAREAGFEAVQTRDPEMARKAGLVPTALMRVDKPEDAKRVAASGSDNGYDCTTLHVGTGFESDGEARELMEAIIEASAALRHPMFVETHRATVTQDMKRTLDLAAACPGLRFNGDFSHWYTGSEMTYGDIDAKITRLKPVFERTRFLHGRVSDPGCIQIPVRDGSQQKHVDRFCRFWTASFSGFLESAAPGDYFGFYPELLPASYHYARLVRDEAGEMTEETDRWTEALHLVGIARDCWAQASTQRVELAAQSPPIR